MLKKLTEDIDKRLFVLHCQSFEGGIINEEMFLRFKCLVISIKGQGFDVKDYERAVSLYEEILDFQNGTLLLVEKKGGGLVKWNLIEKVRSV